MSDAASHPESTAQATPLSPQVDLSKLDDKHLSRYRHPNERRALLSLILGLILILGVLWLAQAYLGNLLNYFPSPIIRAINHWLHPTRLGPILLALVAVMWLMDVVGQSMRAWQLVAQAVEMTPTTFPQLVPIIDNLRQRFDLPRTQVYVSRDAPMKGYTIGVREPYAIVLSSIAVGTFTPDEFKFVLGREMGSIKLGHTRMATLLGNVQMSLPQPFSFLLRFRAVLFGTYHHAQMLSCDRIGVVATRDIRPALSTLTKQNLGTIRGARIDVKSLAPQSQALQEGFSGAALRAAMLFNPQPFAVARLYELVKWAGAPAPVAPSTPATPPPPTPAQSAAAAAASAAAAATSAAEAAASAAAAAASALAATGNTLTPTPIVSADSDGGTGDKAIDATGSGPTPPADPETLTAVVAGRVAETSPGAGETPAAGETSAAGERLDPPSAEPATTGVSGTASADSSSAEPLSSATPSTPTTQGRPTGTSGP